MAPPIREEAVEDETPKEKKKNTSKGKKRYQGKSAEKYREKKNLESEVDFSKDLTSKLSMGFSLPADLNSMTIGQRRVTIPLSVTTKGIGFATLQIGSLIPTVTNLPAHVTLHRLYRIGLAVFEAQQTIFPFEVLLEDVPSAARRSNHTGLSGHVQLAK